MYWRVTIDLLVELLEPRVAQALDVRDREVGGEQRTVALRAAACVGVGMLAFCGDLFLSAPARIVRTTRLVLLSTSTSRFACTPPECSRP